VLWFPPPKRSLQGSKNQIKLNMFFRGARNFSELASSAKIACESINNSLARDEIVVFVKGNRQFLQPLSNSISDSLKLGFVVSNHLLTFQDIEVLVQDANITYVPTDGFNSNTPFNGTYICKKGLEFIEFNATTTQVNTADFTAVPNAGYIRRFSDEVITFSCTANSLSILFLCNFDDRENTTLVYIYNEDRVKVAVLSVTPASTHVKGRCACVTADSKQLVKEWNFEFLGAHCGHY
ncbi:hypothetical protein Ocin01_09931, partial [Orchesella cincta]